MSLKIRRGLAADRTSITPSVGEFLYTTDTKQVYIGDGTTAGGNPISISGVAWGSITGTLIAQTDLTAYLSSNYYPLSTNPAGYLTSSALIPYLLATTAASTYEPIITAGTVSQYWRGDKTWQTFPTIPTVTPSALTKTDDTNVTITLGGSPSTALLAATSLTVGWTGTLADSRIASATTWNAKEPAIAPGTVYQYWRGDKSWQTLPTAPVSGGGASVSYYLNGSIPSSVVGYEQMSKTPVFGIGTDYTTSVSGVVAQFLTDVGDPALLNIPAGNWLIDLYFSVDSSGGTPSFYVELYKYDGVTFSLIVSNSVNPESITNGTSTDLYITSLAVPTTTLTLTDRLAILVYVNVGGKIVTLHTEDTNLAQIVTTFSTGISALNGLTKQIQYIANDTNLTVVSSVDTHTLTWAGTLADSRITSAATWNAKQNALSGTGFVVSTAGVISYDTSVYTPTSRNLTINGTTYDLSADRSWTITASGKSINVVSINTSAGSASSTDYVYLASGTINITLPTAVGNQNLYTIKNVGTGVITIDTTSSQTIDGSLTAPIIVQYLSLTIISDGANWNII